MRRSVATCLLILALVQATTLAQNDARELWLARAQNLTSDLLKDGSDLSSTERAVLWAKLAQRWWSEEPKRARGWIANAVETVEQVPNKEKPDEQQQRVAAAQVLLEIVTPLDQKLSNRLLTLLSPDKSTREEGNGTAFALMNAANALVEEDPERAAALGALALRTGQPNNLDPLFYGLRAKNPKLADSLFVQALALAKQNPDSMFTNVLTYIAFPTQRGRPGDIPVPPEPLRIELLQILMTLITANPSNGKNENSNCGAVIWLAPLYGEIERLIPQQWPVLRQAINTCQTVSPQIQQEIEHNSSNHRVETVESLLSASADVKEIGTRTSFKYRAAALAEEHMDYERALKILDDMSKEERELMGESWTSCRWDWAADGAIYHFKNSRFREMNVLLDGVPSDLRPLAKVAFIHRLPEVKVSEAAPVIQILNDATTELRRSSIPGEQKSYWYMALVRPTITYLPADANAVLKDAVASLNQLKEGQQLDTNDPFKMIGPSLLEMDEFVVKDALASVKLPQTRAQLRLSVLDATLKRLNTASRH